jgi:hypothetical protein
MIAFHTRKWRPKRLFFAPQPLHSAALCWKLRSSALSCAAQIQMLYLLAVRSYDFKTSDLPRQAWERNTMPPGKTAAAAQCQLNKVVTSGAKTRHSSAASAALKRSTATNYSRFHHPLHYKTRRFAKTGSGQTQENPIEKRPKTQNREFYVFSLFAVRGK